jgi:putative protease
MSEHIPALVEAGIDSFKIEGRMKRYEYVAGAVRVYRRLIDRYVEAPFVFRVTDEEKRTLRQLFNRGFTTGYFFGDPGSELMSRNYPHNRGTELGSVVDYEPGKKMVSIYLKAQLRVGDGIGIGVRDTGVTVKGIYIGKNKVVSTACEGSTVKLPLEQEVTTGEPVFKTYDSLLMASLEVKNTGKIPVKMTFKAHIDEPVELLISDGKNEIKIQGSSTRPAESRPISKNAIAEQLKKLGNTIFEARELNIEMDDNIFIPVSGINSLRREGIDRLLQVRTRMWKRQCNIPIISHGQKLVKPGSPILSVNTGSIESFKAAIDGGADVVYIGSETYVDIETNEKPQINRDERKFVGVDNLRYAIECGRKKGVKVFFSTPRIIKNINELPDFYSSQRTQRLQSDTFPDGFIVANPGVLHHLRSLDSITPIVLDHPFNIFNRLTMEYLLRSSQRVTLSPELKLKEIKDLTSYGSTECIVHGNFPLMVSEHDIARGIFPKGAGEVCLEDEKGFVFPVKTDLQGRTYVMNSREICMIEHVPDLIKAGVDCLRIEAKMYDREITERITRAYRDAIDDCGKKKCSDFGEYTKGHYFRGVL